ncbi:MAG: cysteine-rich small domain-containing protein, partial [Candidatus Methanomethylophilaceae archaeon]
MEWTKEKVREELERGWTGPNEECPYHPCHYHGQDCTYCFCPFYPCQDPELGGFVISSRTGEQVWSCVDCHLMHRADACRYVAERVDGLGIRDPEDLRLPVLFLEVKSRFLRSGKALMILGATSGAGKSLTVTALCRIIANMRRSVTPFKSQNMSLNSYVTKGGHEISRI